MKDKLTILVADDDQRHRAMLATLLNDWGYAVMEAADGVEAAALCGNMTGERRPPDLALLDVRMPRKNGLDALLEIKRLNSGLPVVIMTAYSEIPAAVDAIRNGAYDYLTKPLDFDKLKVTLRNAFAHLGLERENASLSATLASRENRNVLLGSGRAMAGVRDMIRAIAPTEATVLVSGESGTGKELAARAIHQASRHGRGPFVAVNCGALTESLLASELFGHEKGAFTGADRKHEGLFLEAGDGSIFLDEIGEMPLSMQVKLLRVLQEREVLSVGGKKARPINCRVIAATNRDLALEAEAGRFRQDLYYRLNVVSLHMPPLRERPEDIPGLAQHFANRFAAANHKRLSGFTREAMARLLAYRWPGNVRELENVIERAIILMPGETLGERELPPRLLEDVASGPQNSCMAAATAGAVENAGRGDIADGVRLADEELEREAQPFSMAGCPTLEEVERTVILQTLKRLGGNKTETARVLGITRKTLHAKLNRYREDSQQPDSRENLG